MNAVVATPAQPSYVVLPATRQRPFLLHVERDSRCTGVLAMHRNTSECIASAWRYDAANVYLQITPQGSSLYVGDGKFNLTHAEAERLRDELQLPVRSST